MIIKGSWEVGEPRKPNVNFSRWLSTTQKFRDEGRESRFALATDLKELCHERDIFLMDHKIISVLFIYRWWFSKPLNTQYSTVQYISMLSCCASKGAVLSYTAGKLSSDPTSKLLSDPCLMVQYRLFYVSIRYFRILKIYGSAFENQKHLPYDEVQKS